MIEETPSTLPRSSLYLNSCPPAIDRQTHLRVKIKTLAVEATLIRHEEQRYPGASSTRTSLREHRVGIVRREQRASLLAYAFLRGRQYLDVERGAKSPPSHARVAKIAKSFGSPLGFQDTYLAVVAWFQEQRAEPCGRQPEVMTPV